MNELLSGYKLWAEKVQEELRRDTSWISQYKDYALSMLDEENKDIYTKASGRFRRIRPLYVYLTIGEVYKRNRTPFFDLRYLGQSVGSIKVKKDAVTLSVSKDQAANSKKFFGYSDGPFEDKSWSGSTEAKRFRAYFKGDKDLAGTAKSGRPHSDEHMVESVLYSELEKTSSVNKTLLNIQPVKYAGTRIHMKTALAASKAGKNESVFSSRTGGEIDCLCRRNVKPGESRLAAIEIKDENKESESFDIAMKQAVSYAVFLRELIHSEAGEGWKAIWGMGNQYKTTVAIDAVVAMPEGKTKPGYSGERIEFENGDFIELHYIEITGSISPENTEDVKFRTSLPGARVVYDEKGK